MSKEIHLLLYLAFGIVFYELAPVVEQDSYYAAFHLYVFGVWIARVETFEQMKHLVCVVEQSARECVVHAGGCWFLTVRFVKFVGILPYEHNERILRAE